MAILDEQVHVAVNRRYADLYGYTDPDALVGDRWHDRLVAETDGRLQREVLPACRQSGRWRGEIEGRRRGGDTIPLDLTLVHLEDGQFACSVREMATAGGSGRDLSSHHRIVEHVFDAIDDIVYVIDEDGESRLWNESLVETTGYSHEEIDAMDPVEFIPEDHHEYVPGLLEAIDALEDRRVELDVLTKAGERIPHEFSGTTIEDPRTGELLRYGVARDVSDRRERERELQRYETIIETVDDGIYVLDENLAFEFVNDAFCELAGTSKDDLEGRSVMELFEYDDEKAVAEDIRERVVAGDTTTGTVQGTITTADDERRLEARYRLHPEPDPDDGYRGSIGIVRDVTRREARERRLQRRRDELATLDRISELVLAVTRDLFESASRRDIEATVCEDLASSDLYRFAWIGGPEPGGDRLVPRVAAGIDEDYVESTLVAAETDAPGPARRAFRSGEAVVSQDVCADPDFEQWRPAASDHGVRSAAAVPLVHGDATYGVLAVYATRPLAFSRRERQGFETLGRAVGFAVSAIDDRKLLYADAVVELEFEVDDPGLAFVRVSDRLGCELAVTGCVESEAGTWSVYVTVDGAEPDAVADAAVEGSDVTEVRVIAEEDHGGALEFVMTGPVIEEFSEHGAVLTSCRVDGGRGRFCIEVPRSADVRRLTDRLRTAYPDTTLVAQREHERQARTAMEVRQSLDDRLTDRQREALERATYAGYFEWPRTNAAGDIAEAMGISETTFHYHLRNGLDTLLGTLTDR